MPNIYFRQYITQDTGEGKVSILDIGKVVFEQSTHFRSNRKIEDGWIFY